MKRILSLFILSFLFSSSVLAAEDYYREVSPGVATLGHHQGHTFTRIDLEGVPLILDSRCHSYPCTLQVKEGDTPFSLMGSMANSGELLLLAGGKLEPGTLIIKDPRGGLIGVIPPKK